ncbi:MAG: recombination protein RecR, partial [Aedoeadaptatus pacaensis]
PVKDLIRATTPTTDGELPARYITRMLEDVDIHITRIAHGIPVGGDLEYYDELTVATALAHRTDYREK